MKEEATLAVRLTTEIKHSPVKSAVLGLGCIVALYVWVPRLLGAATSASSTSPTNAPADATNRSSPVAPALEPAAVGTPTPPDLSMRDSLAIRAEFIAISKEAQELHRFADAVPSRNSQRNPFLGQRPAKADAEPTPAPLASADVAAPETIAADSEKMAAADVRVDGIMIFGAHAKALVSGRLLGVGDEVGTGITIASIAPRSITLKGAFGEYRIDMTTGSKKESP